MNNIPEEKLKKHIEDFVSQKGWPGFFGLLASISPTKVDEGDLRKYNGSIEKNNEPKSPVIPKKENIENKPIAEASIYAVEHIEAVNQDLEEQRQSASETLEHNKVRILENKNVPPISVQSTPIVETTPNPWAAAKSVEPGEVKEILTR